jgi:hypothetical protein
MEKQSKGAQVNVAILKGVWDDAPPATQLLFSRATTLETTLLLVHASERKAFFAY